MMSKLLKLIRTTKNFSSMNKSKVATAIFCVSILANLITGCDNSKAANDDNFKKAIAAVLPEQQLNCIDSGSSTDIYGISKLLDFPLEMRKSAGAAPADIQALTKVGILSASEVTIT